MVLQIELPTDVSEALHRSFSDVPAHVLELIAIDGYGAGTLTEDQVGIMLGLDQEQASDFLLKAGFTYDVTEEEFEEQLRIARKLKFFSKLEANLGNSCPADQDRLADEFRALILDR